MMRWTPEQLQEYQQRHEKKPSIEPASDEPDVPESHLQSKIEAWCKERGLFLFHDRSRGVNPAGMLDLVIALPYGNTLWLELKRPKGGRLSDQQRQTILRLKFLHHDVEVIRTFPEFLRIMNRMLDPDDRYLYAMRGEKNARDPGHNSDDE